MFMLIAVAAGLVTTGAFIGASLSNYLFKNSDDRANTNELKSEIKVMSTEIKQTSALEIALLVVILTFATLILLAAGAFATNYIVKKCKKNNNKKNNDIEIELQTL